MKTPRLPETSLREILEANNVDQSVLSIIAIRGYYLDSMGVVGKNDRSIYDDAMFVVWPDGVARFQANTDPSGWRKGHGTGSSKGMAMLKEGIHIYGTGLHKGRQAFRQCEKFTVMRDGNPPYSDLDYHGINLHPGGYTSTSSLGCQTVPAPMWPTFKVLVYRLLDDCKNPKRKNDRGELVRSFNYVLMNETDRRNDQLIVSNRYL